MHRFSDDEGSGSPPGSRDERGEAGGPPSGDAGPDLGGTEPPAHIQTPQTSEPPAHQRPYDARSSNPGGAAPGGAGQFNNRNVDRHGDRNAWHGAPPDRGPVYGALDLGTNNCRLLLARPSRRGFRVVDAFSRIIRLGEGVSQSGRLSNEAMDRTIEALRICAAKLVRKDVARARCVATEACRIAANGEEFLTRVTRETGLAFEILSREAEAGLAVAGCASLIDTRADYVMVFDIGGGSSELIWLDLTKSAADGHSAQKVRNGAASSIAAWTSLPAGVVTLAERYGGRNVTPESFEAMIDHVAGLIGPFEDAHGFRERTKGATVHLLGTSGTVTTVAGIRLGLPRYDRTRVDGCWLEVDDVRAVTYDLLDKTYEQRAAEPCIGPERADLVLAGCAILEALLRAWPCERLRVADRGLREGILTKLMTEDGVFRNGRRRRGR